MKKRTRKNKATHSKLGKPSLSRSCVTGAGGNIRSRNQCLRREPGNADLFISKVSHVATGHPPLLFLPSFPQNNLFRGHICLTPWRRKYPNAEPLSGFVLALVLSFGYELRPTLKKPDSEMMNGNVPTARPSVAPFIINRKST